MRSMDGLAELQAIGEYDTLSQAARTRLHAQRKRHKESAVLMPALRHRHGSYVRR